MFRAAPSSFPLRDRAWRASTLPATHPLRPWLTDPGSLTARIAARCGQLRVTVIAQELACPHRDEARLAGLRRGELAWLREVLLVADGVPVVYARSILSRKALRLGWRMLAGVGDRPLGSALFADPRVRRGALGAKRLDARDRRYHRAAVASGLALPPALWARRSCFLRKGRPLIVCEIFLPAVLDLLDPQ